MLKKLFKAALKMILYAVILALILFGLPRAITGIYAATRTYTVEDAPNAPVAIVLGAGLSRAGYPSPVLQDRVATAADLYFAGKVQKLLMSGDNRFEDYNEPAAMKAYAIQLGVPAADIVEDFAGRRTYDTCFRAGYIFGVKEAVIVTQAFHLPRSVFLCNTLNVKAAGVPADRRTYLKRSLFWWNARELVATTGALWDAWVSHPLPVLGDPEFIFPVKTQK